MSHNFHNNFYSTFRNKYTMSFSPRNQDKSYSVDDFVSFGDYVAVYDYYVLF